MKKFLPILFGVLIPFTFYIYLVTKDSPTTEVQVKETLGVQVGFGDPNVEKLTEDQYYNQLIQKIVYRKKGTYSVYIKDLEDNWVSSIGQKYSYYAASLYKIPVAIKILELVASEELSLEDTVTYTNVHYYGGSGKIKEKAYGTVFTIEQLLTHLIKDSDNVAQSMLFTKISKDDVYELMPSPTTVTTSEITALLENLYSGSYLEEEETDFLLSLMAKTSFDNRVDAGLVKGLAFSHKIGNWANTGSWHDCGVVDGPKKLVVCVMSKGTSFEDFLRVTESVGELVSKISIQSQK